MLTAEQCERLRRLVGGAWVMFTTFADPEYAELYQRDLVDVDEIETNDGEWEAVWILTSLGSKALEGCV